MDLSYDNLKNLILSPSLSESEIKKLLNKIHENFILNRQKIEDYVESKEMVSAYSLFYLPTNILKLPFVLSQLDRETLEEIGKTTILDVGSGPGTYSLGFLEFLQVNSLVLIDKSELMLNQAVKFIENFFPDFKNVAYLKNLDSFKPSGDITLFFGNSINEMGFEKAMGLIEKFKPRFLFFIEPGTKDFFKMALKIRNKVRGEGYSVIYPCPSLISGCPLENKNDWCHQILNTTLDPSIERLSQILKKDRRAMPFISHLYRLSKSVSFTKARLIRILPETKFAFIWEVCIEENGSIQIKRFEVLKKTLSKKALKKLKKESTGITVEFEVIKKITQDYWRVNLTNPCFSQPNKGSSHFEKMTDHL
jgi:ribosomal protein RSM22 (predicted rRNA methylase)